MFVQSNWKRRLLSMWFQETRAAAVTMQRGWRRFVPYKLRLRATFQNEYRIKFQVRATRICPPLPPLRRPPEGGVAAPAAAGRAGGPGPFRHSCSYAATRSASRWSECASDVPVC